MSGVYTVPFVAVAVTAAQDLFEIVPASGKPCVILGWDLAQTSDFGDAQEEILSIAIKSGQTTTGSGGSTVTPVAVDTANTIAAGFTAKANNTTKATAGTILTHMATGWNVRVPWEKVLTQEQQYLIAAGRRVTIELVGAPNDSITLNGTLYVQEIG